MDVYLKDTRDWLRALEKRVSELEAKVSELQGEPKPKPVALQELRWTGEKYIMVEIVNEKE